jgi:signal transduction histidine kinase
MRLFDIRDRMLLAALLPVTLVAVLLSTVFLAGRYADLDEAHQQRARSLARQLASASEYGLFSGNLAALQTIAAGALREQDVRSVMILDARGQALAMAGSTGRSALPALSKQEQQWVDDASGNELLVQPVVASPLRLDDPYEVETPVAGESAAALLGHVVVEVSRTTLVSRGHDMLMIGMAVTLGGLLFGGVLAVRIGQGVIRPVLRVSDMIERIGRGELSVRGTVRPDDPLRDLQAGLNQMAEHLQQGRDELERRVALATAELRARKEEAETATLAKSRFLAAASHDLRQPIHALGMFVARLAQLPHDRETRHLIANLEASVRAMQDLLDALLDISRLDADAVRVHVQPTPLSRLFEQLRGALLPMATDKGLRLRMRASDLWVQSDPTLLHRILLNLVSNALRYTGRGGVLVGCRRSRGGSHVWIEVWDTGVGIAPEHQQDVFREFYQIGNPERDRSKGLGLGLNIVERTARLLGHPLQLCSIPGSGTRFRVEVPLAPPGDPAAYAAASDAAVLDDVRGLRVLLIEDDRQSAQALRGLLDSWGCIVAVAEGLQGAQLTVSGGFNPDLILSDFRLRAGESGLQSLQRLRSSLRHSVPACLMSGDTDPALIQACRDVGLPLLHKPVRPAKLRTLMRRLVRRA